MSALRIGTRGSALALWQARTVAALLEASGSPAELVIIKTSGDRLQERPLSEIGGKRLFVKEIEDALLRGEVDLAVHSAKDMPAVLPEGLGVAATLPREDPRDALVLPTGIDGGDLRGALAHLGETPIVGTGSVRRIAQLSALLPQATFAPIRGNVDTRLRKLDAGDFNALVLAAAGLKRLGFGARISALVSFDDWRSARSWPRSVADASCRSARSPGPRVATSTCRGSWSPRTARKWRAPGRRDWPRIRVSSGGGSRIS